MDMGIVVLGSVFVDVKGYPLAAYIPGGRNSGRVEQVHGGVARNVAEDIANVELRPTFLTLVDDTGMGDEGAAMEIFGVGHEIIEEFFVLVADTEHV